MASDVLTLSEIRTRWDATTIGRGSPLFSVDEVVVALQLPDRHIRGRAILGVRFKDDLSPTPIPARPINSP